jgi:hypothetical protein
MNRRRSPQDYLRFYKISSNPAAACGDLRRLLSSASFENLMALPTHRPGQPSKRLRYTIGLVVSKDELKRRLPGYIGATSRLSPLHFLLFFSLLAA